MDIKVSVVMPVYNAHDYLADSLESIMGQTLREIEIICVDDGSTDDTPQILAQYAQKDSRIRVITQKNGGAGAARNNGMQYATGEYLSILDCDDFFEPTMLEESYRAAKEKYLDIVVFGCDFYDNESATYRPCDYSIHYKLLPQQEVFCADDVPKDLFKVFVGWSWDKLFRTSFVRRHGLTFQEQRTTNDMLFVFGALLRAQRISVLPLVLAHHRRGVESLSVTREKSWMCFYDALMDLRKQLKQLGLYERFERDYKNYCVHFSLWNINSLKEPTHTLLYNKLRDEWFEEMGLLEHPKEYFYNQYEYSCYRKIYENPIEVLEGGQQSVKEPVGIFARGWQCVKDHGLWYTVKHFVKKVLKKIR